MRKKYFIQVRNEGPYMSPGTIKFGIMRTLKAEQIGNFNPVFCQYKGEKKLVKSLLGDFSDPFRREETYIEGLYITV